MKILSGVLKGRRLTFSKNPHLRPTSDKVRQAIFNILRGKTENAKVLDLFAGTGALGIEALSNGAGFVQFVEVHPAQASEIRCHLTKLGLETRAQVMTLDAIGAVKRFSKNKEKFDLIFLDPPYGDSLLLLSTLESILRTGIAGIHTLLLIECNTPERSYEMLSSLRVLKEKIYGDTKLVVTVPEGHE